MKLYLLDAGGAALVFGFMIIFMIGAVVIEALIMLAMKYNRAGKSFLDSLIINLSSLLTGFILIAAADSLAFFDNDFLNFTLLFLITLLVETLILYLLNRSKPLSKTVITATVINLASYGLLYLLTIL